MLPLANFLRNVSIAILPSFGCLGLLCDTAWSQDLFPDKGFEAVVRKEVFEKRNNSEPLTAEDVKNVSQIVGKGKGIKSLEGIQHCKALMKIDLENNEISDLTQIQDLKQLQSIDIASNKIVSIIPLAGLVQLQYVHLSKNEIADISPLKDLANLRSIYMADNKIKSLEPLAGIKKAWTLHLAGNPIEDANAIGQMKSVDSINLKGCGLKEIGFVRTLKPNFLMMAGNPISDFGPLVELVEADAQGDRRFAPFMRLYLDDAVLKDATNASAFEKIRAAGVRINPENK